MPILDFRCRGRGHVQPSCADLCVEVVGFGDGHHGGILRPASAWTSDDTATAATLLDGVLRLFDDVAGVAKQAQAADIEADRRALIASGGCVVTDVQAAIKQVWGRDEAVKRFYGMVNNGAIARNLWTKCRPELRVSTWELSAVQQVVVNVWNADVAEENAGPRLPTRSRSTTDALTSTWPPPSIKASATS